MYEEYYGFVEKPFSLTPDPKYLYKSESHSSAFDLLQYAIRRREGFVVITGDIGTGKTTICRAILEQIDRKTFTALVLNPFLSEEDLLKLILQDFGVVSRDEVKRGRLAGVSKQELIDTLYDFLLSLLPLNAGAVLVIDEAQNLPPHVLEQIRILSNLETDKEKLLQIVLVGQLNLKSVLRSPDMRQLDQRVSIRYELKPLTRDEVGEYVAHRLSVAGGGASVAFTPRALDALQRLSGGIPRLINLLCDRALLAGYAARTNRIVPEMVLKAADSLDLRDTTPRLFPRVRRRAFLALTGAAAIAVMGAAGVGLASHQRLPPFERWSAATGVISEARRASTETDARVDPLSSETAKAPVGSAPGRDVAGTRGGQPVKQLVVGSEPYSILVGSFLDPAKARDLSAELTGLGYRVYAVDVDAGEQGRLRQLLVGRYADAGEALQDEARLRQLPAFSDARLVVSSTASESRQ